MLRNTLILPETDARLAGQYLRDAIDDLDVVLMLVIGRDDPAEQIVNWADMLANKTRVSETYNLRRIVWIRKPDVAPVKAILDEMLGSERPLIVVLNFHDKVVTKIASGQGIGPLDLEKAFVQGHKV